jgi:hypothetical protein
MKLISRCKKEPNRRSIASEWRGRCPHAQIDAGCNVTWLAAGGSSLYTLLFRGALAQLVRAPPCHGGGCGFEPRRLRASSHRALDSENRRNDTSNFARTHVSNVNEKRHRNLERAAYGRSNVGSDARNGTLLRGASGESGGCASSPAVDSRPHLCRLTWSSHRRGHCRLWRQRARRVARL